jgi:GrpB-like predicted nucleotidyltransferase (UPF0157 family)
VPPPIPVRLTRHDPEWSSAAAELGDQLVRTVRSVVRVHHVGSTAVPGLDAKPILDLIPVLKSLERFDANRHEIEALGYGWHGEYGIVGRRYCTLDDASSRHRIAQLHCFVDGDPNIERHLAVRDYLAQCRAVRVEYELEKRRCARLHPDDSHAYSDCKADFLQQLEADALKRGSVGSIGSG